MASSEKFYPKAENLGKNCKYWDNREGCLYPKVEMEGRRSCEGVVDDVCLFIKDGRTPQSLTPDQILKIKIRIPDPNRNIDLPPGDTT